MMRYLLIAVLLLGGCVNMPQPYDNVLYDKYVSSAINLLNAMDACDTSRDVVITNVQKSLNALTEASLFVKYRGDEKTLMDATTFVRDDLNTFLKNYTQQSPTYCHYKMMIAEAELIDIVKAVGGK